MARKAPGKGARKAKAAPAPKRKSRGAAAPARKRAGPTAYEKRLAEYQRTHPGWRHDPHWKQKARGHKEAEHVIRAQRLRDRVNAFAEEQARRYPENQAVRATRLATELWAQIKIHGESRLKQIQDTVALLERERAARPKDERGRPQRLDWGSRRVPWLSMEDLADKWNLPVEIFGYH